MKSPKTLVIRNGTATLPDAVVVSRHTRAIKRLAEP